MLIISPPLAKPCEPPASLAYLAGALKAHNQAVTVCDMNIEGIHYLLQAEKGDDSTWTKRAVKNLSNNLAALKSSTTYTNKDRYRRAVADINRVLEVNGKRYGLQLNLANYTDPRLFPLKSEDLLQAAKAFDENIFYPYFSGRLDELLEETGAEHIGISINYLSQALTSFAIIGYLRAKHPDKKILAGGGLITTWLSQPGWKQPFHTLIDWCVDGKGEEPLLDFFKIVQKKKEYRPNYDTLFQNNYLSPGFILPYTTSRGCFWKKCNFCPETSEDNPYEHNVPKKTLADLTTLQQETSPALIHLLDNAISPSTLTAVVRNGLASPWYSFARFSKELLDLEFCAKLRHSGCVMLKLGLESGDQNVLNEMNKGINLGMVSLILKNLKEAGIATYTYLLFGTPAEDLDAALRTKEFIEDHHEEITFLNLAIFNLPTCSSQTTELAVSDFYEGDLSMYRNFDHPKGWSRGKIRRFLDTNFKRSPEIAAILQNDPPFFSSNHAPLLAPHLMAQMKWYAKTEKQ